jgi:adenylosuccinate lyase
MAAVRAGVGRETAHEVVKEHAVAVALEMREQGSEGNDLAERLGADPRLGLDAAAVLDAMGDPASFIGTAPRQVAAFVDRVAAIATRYPDAASYQGEEIL